MDTTYLVIARWEPNQRVAIWLGGVFETEAQAREMWAEFERSVGGGTLVDILRIDLIATQGGALWDATVDFSRT